MAAKAQEQAQTLQFNDDVQTNWTALKSVLENNVSPASIQAAKLLMHAIDVVDTALAKAPPVK